MKILCGVDFSEQSQAALDVAAALAEKLGDRLVVAHAFEVPAVASWESGAAMELAARQREAVSDELQAAVKRVAKSFPDVEGVLLEGRPGRKLAESATEMGARLIVLALHSRRMTERLLLGSVADEVARVADRPLMLVAGDTKALAANLRSTSTLKLTVAADFSMATDAAVHWVNELRGHFASDVTFVHAYWPPGEYQRLGLSGFRDLYEPDPEVVPVLEHDLKQRIGELAGRGTMSLRILPTLGRPAEPVLDAAKDAHADLIVIGTHGRRGLERLWPGSVAQTVLHNAPTTVVCVPVRAREGELELKVPRFRTVLAATDFSRVGDEAVLNAYGMVAPGGVVVLCHVTAQPAAGEAASRAVEEKLRARMPAEAPMRGITTRCLVVHGSDAGKTIVQAAERGLADAVVVGSHGMGGIAAALGSTAQQVLRVSHKPVLVVRAQK